MRKKLLFAVLICFIAVITGCSTIVDIDYMKSSNVNMGQYRNIAVASAIPYRGGYMNSAPYMRYYDFDSSLYPVYSSYSKSLPSDVASYATDAVVSSLSQNGFFKIMYPAETDAMITLSRIGVNSSEKFVEAGIDAVIIPTIEEMNVDEYSRVYVDSYKEKVDPSTGVKTKVPHYKYAYYQRVSLTLSLTVIDTRTERIIAKRIYTKQDPTYEEYTYTPYGAGYILPYSSVNNPYYTFKSQINSFKRSIRNDFIPRMVSASIELMSNKPKIKSLEAAYKAADDGNLSLAYDAFISEWNSSRHVPSAYNAAILQAARGDIAGAIDFLSSVRSTINNDDINSLYSMMLSYKAEDDKAKSQLAGESSEFSGDVSAIYSIYNALGK